MSKEMRATIPSTATAGNGGSGANNLWGGAGADQFQFTDAVDRSIVRDFVSGQDRLQFDTSIVGSFSDLTITDNVDGNAHRALSSNGTENLHRDFAARPQQSAHA